MTIDVALKEWALVCDLLTGGDQIVLVRKGGIHEPRRGFAIEHDAFLLYPNTEHQNSTLVRPEFRSHFEGNAPLAPAAESGVIPVPGFCRVTDVLVLPDLDAADRLSPLACWTQAYYEMRFAYKPERPVYAALVRAHRFAAPAPLAYHKTYAGCRSWVPLKETLPESILSQARPALDDAEFARRRAAVLEALGMLIASAASRSFR
jgi:hypothetical protein